jgi:hypothetical protein
MEDLKKYEGELEIKKMNLVAAIKEVEYELKQVKQTIYNECKVKTGHDFIAETEEGIYGETFYICKYCNYEQ